MKDLIVGDQATVERLSELLKQAKTVTQFRRIQCVLLRIKLGCSAQEIAQLVGLVTTTVHVIHSSWAKHGDTVFDTRARGGRRRQNLTCEQEQQLLAPFIERAQHGHLVGVNEIEQAYRQCMGKQKTSRTSIYRLLHRHGWRKVVPRPRHPKADVAAQAVFKKTAPKGASGSWAPG